MSKIILEGHIMVSDADLPAVKAELPIHIQEEGCLRFDVTQSPGTGNVFFVSEVFIDQAAFEAHQRRVRLSDWGRVASNVERHYQVTEAD